jgi:hypothetical protein
MDWAKARDDIEHRISVPEGALERRKTARIASAPNERYLDNMHSKGNLFVPGIIYHYPLFQCYSQP